MFCATDIVSGMWVFVIVNRLLHQLVVGFSSHKWVGSRVGTSRVTRPGVR
jgi:hypothetical protein